MLLPLASVEGSVLCATPSGRTPEARTVTPFLLLLCILLSLIDVSHEYSYKLNLMSPSSKASNILLITGPLTHATSKQSVVFFLDFGGKEIEENNRMGKTKDLLMNVKEESLKSWLKAEHSEN